MTADDMRQWRAEMCYTQADAAQALGVSLSSVQKYELRTRPLPVPISLACAAIKAGLPPYVAGEIAHENMKPRTQRKPTALYEYNGERLSLWEWSKRTGINQRTLKMRIDCGWPIDDVLTRPRYQRRGKGKGQSLVP
jgi:DNA-binding XRE family transcriptional regulator